MCKEELVCAETLSRFPITDKEEEDILAAEAKGFVDQILKELPLSQERLNELGICLKQDEVCVQVLKYCIYGWPDCLRRPSTLWKKIGDSVNHVFNEIGHT